MSRCCLLALSDTVVYNYREYFNTFVRLSHWYTKIIPRFPLFGGRVYHQGGCITSLAMLYDLPGITFRRFKLINSYVQHANCSVSSRTVSLLLHIDYNYRALFLPRRMLKTIIINKWLMLNTIQRVQDTRRWLDAGLIISAWRPSLYVRSWRL